jgi:hypothetical protein
VARFCRDNSGAGTPCRSEQAEIGGSLRHDLIEFTLLKDYLGAGRLKEAGRLMHARRPGAAGIVAAVQ